MTVVEVGPELKSYSQPTAMLCFFALPASLELKKKVSMCLLVSLPIDDCVLL